MCDPAALHDILSYLLKKRTFVPTTITGHTDEGDTGELGRLANYGGARYISNPEFTALLGERSGFPEQVDKWMYKGILPNGMARAIILACAAELNAKLRAQYERPIAA